MTATIHLHPTAALAPRVLLPGDPGRALLLAQTLLDTPLMFNHNRGLWGYTGADSDGAPLTIQSTGMGGPSAAIVVHELVELGARELIRVGTCGALAPAVALGDLIVAEAARHGDAEERPDPRLTAALQGEHRGPVITTDAFYDADLGRQERWRAEGALAVEMECAAIFSVARERGAAAAALLLVSDIVLPERRRIAPDALRAGEERLGRVAAEALQSL